VPSGETEAVVVVQVISAARTCSILLIVLDVAKPATHKILIERELDGFGIRLNQVKCTSSTHEVAPPDSDLGVVVVWCGASQEPPRITFKKKAKGGVNFQAAVPQSHLDTETVTAILKEYRIHSADVFLRCDATIEQFIDVVEGNRKYMPAIYLLNKVGREGCPCCLVGHYRRLSSSRRARSCLCSCSGGRLGNRGRGPRA
jgi:ribosome-interacting GTPase 1